MFFVPFYIMKKILIAIKDREKIKKWNSILEKKRFIYEFIVLENDLLLIIDKNNNIISKYQTKNNKINKYLLSYRNYALSDESFYTGFKTKKECLLKISILLNTLNEINFNKYLFLVSSGSGSYFKAVLHDYLKKSKISAYRIIYNRQFNIDNSANFYVSDNNQSIFSNRIPIISSQKEIRIFVNKINNEYLKYKSKNKVNKNRIKFRSASSLNHFFIILFKFIIKLFTKKDLSFYILKRQLFSSFRKLYYLLSLSHKKPKIYNKTVIYYLNVFGDAQVNLRNPQFINPIAVQKKLSQSFDTINFKLHPADLGGLTLKQYFFLKKLKVNFIIKNDFDNFKLKNVSASCLNGSIIMENSMRNFKTYVLGKSFMKDLAENKDNIYKLLKYYTCEVGNNDSIKQRHKILAKIIDKIISYEL